MKVLVTGGSGFVGTNIVRKLLAKKYKVRIIDLSPPDKNLLRKVDFIQGDILDFKKMMQVCKDIDYVIHTVALVPISRAGKKFGDVNVQGTENVLESAYRNKVKKVIHISSSSVYGAVHTKAIKETDTKHPLGEYGETKREAEIVCEKYMKRGLNIVVFVPRALLGEGRLGIVSLFSDWLREGKNIYILGSGDNHYRFLSIDDLTDACLLALKKGKNEFFNVGTDKYSTIRKDLQTVIDHAGTGSKIISIPSGPGRLLLRILDLLKLSPLVEMHYGSMDKEYVLDISKAKKKLGWKPKKSNSEMIIETYEWYMENREKYSKDVESFHKKPVKEGILKLVKLFS